MTAAEIARLINSPGTNPSNIKRLINEMLGNPFETDDIAENVAVS